MAEPIQPSLFPETEPQPFDVDAFANHVAAHAPKDPYKEQRIRELRAAGLDPRDYYTETEEPVGISREQAVEASLRRHPSGYMRKNQDTPPVTRGESEADVHLPHYYEEPVILKGDEQRAALSGIARLKDDLRDTRS